MTKADVACVSLADIALTSMLRGETDVTKIIR